MVNGHDYWISVVVMLDLVSLLFCVTLRPTKYPTVSHSIVECGAVNFDFTLNL